MLLLKQIQENPDEIIKRLAVKNFDATKIVADILKIEEERKSLQQALEHNAAELNSTSKKIGLLMKDGDMQAVETIKQTTAKLKANAKELQEKVNVLEKNSFELLVQLPNLPHASVPKGKSEADNEIIKTVESNIVPENTRLPHWELAKKYNLIDFELGNKITGAGFPVYIGKGAKLQRALIRFFLDEAEKNDFLEYIPPLLVNEDTAFGTGQLPDKEGQMYHATVDNFFLVPTAEVPLTNIYRDVIIDEKDLPIKMTAYTPCFRREAGSYGKDVRGLNRVHQFDKVEIVQIISPEKSYKALDEMVSYVEGLLKKLMLPYRILRLCGGDLSFTSALTFDFEVFSGAQEKWLEVSSVSNFETFQSNRMKIRIKQKGEKKKILAHTLNGSALALPRIMAALLENNQTSTGIKIPKVLVDYTGFDIIRK
jgi:seryl-tRNA synthetase